MQSELISAKISRAMVGNRNGASGSLWRSKIKKVLRNYWDDEIKAGEALERIAHRIVKAAIYDSGEDWRFAVQEIGNRMDGKAGSGPGEGRGGITILIQNYSEQDILKPPITIETDKLEHLTESST